MLRQEMFLTNIESLMPGLQNLWSEVKLFLLSAETLPVLLISKAVTVVWIIVYIYIVILYSVLQYTYSIQYLHYTEASPPLGG